MSKMNKAIEVRLLGEAEEYFNNLNEKIQTKILKSFDKTQMGLKGDWFKYLKGSDGIWEFRERDHQKFYRVFAFWDSTGETETLIIATHGFDKKSNKTPNSEIKKAERIKSKYFETKK